MEASFRDSEDLYLTPVRGLNEFVYCPRLFHLMYVQGLFEESLDTLEGQIAHQKRLQRGKASAGLDEKSEDILPWKTDLVRELTLSSERLGIVGKFDVLLFESGEAVPVEVKHGPAPENRGYFTVGPFKLEGYA